MSFSVDVGGNDLKNLERDIKQAGKGVNERIETAFAIAAPIIMTTISRKVPKDTGALKKSMGHEILRGKATLRIGALKSSINPKTGKEASTYAGHVHGGTSRMPARPFITDAIDKHTGPYSTLMKEMAKAGVTPIDLTVNVNYGSQ